MEKKIYHLGSAIVSGEEVNSFQVLDDLTALTKKRVIYEGREIAKADPATFQLITTKLDPGPNWKFCGRDTKNIYCEGLHFRGVEADSFDYMALLKIKTVCAVAMVYCQLTLTQWFL